MAKKEAMNGTIDLLRQIAEDAQRSIRRLMKTNLPHAVFQAAEDLSGQAHDIYRLAVRLQTLDAADSFEKEVGTEVPCSNDGEENMMTAAELGAKLGVSRALVSRWTKEGVPCVYIGKVKGSKRGARPRYAWQQVCAWLEGRDARKEEK